MVLGGGVREVGQVVEFFEPAPEGAGVSGSTGSQRRVCRHVVLSICRFDDISGRRMVSGFTVTTSRISPP